MKRNGQNTKLQVGLKPCIISCTYSAKTESNSSKNCVFMFVSNLPTVSKLSYYTITFGTLKCNHFGHKLDSDSEPMVL